VLVADPLFEVAAATTVAIEVDVLVIDVDEVGESGAGTVVVENMITVPEMLVSPAVVLLCWSMQPPIPRTL
jgi:hypothetical protein